MKVAEAVAEHLKLKKKRNESDVKFRLRVADALDELDDEQFEALPETLQEWGEASVQAINAKEDPPPFDIHDAVEDPEPEPEPEPAEEPEPEEPAEDDEPPFEDSEPREAEAEPEPEEKPKKRGSKKRGSKRKVANEGEVPRGRVTSNGAIPVLREVVLNLYMASGEIPERDAVEAEYKKTGHSLAKGSFNTVLSNARAMLEVIDGSPYSLVHDEK